MINYNRVKGYIMKINGVASAVLSIPVSSLILCINWALVLGRTARSHVEIHQVCLSDIR